MLPSEELAVLYKKQLIAIEEEVINLFRRFIKASPVSTGAFRSAWGVNQVSSTEWIITNDTEYAIILFDGRRFVAGQWFGSEQWVEGGEVMLKRFNRALERRLKKIKV